jgi:hypothetical protein
LIPKAVTTVSGSLRFMKQIVPYLPISLKVLESIVDIVEAIRAEALKPRSEQLPVRVRIRNKHNLAQQQIGTRRGSFTARASEHDT